MSSFTNENGNGLFTPNEEWALSPLDFTQLDPEQAYAVLKSERVQLQNLARETKPQEIKASPIYVAGGRVATALQYALKGKSLDAAKVLADARGLILRALQMGI